MSSWRDTARPAMFFMVDARATFPLLLFLLHMRLWTLIVASVFILVFVLLERRDMTIPVFLRSIRSWLAGNRRYAIPWWQAQKYK